MLKNLILFSLFIALSSHARANNIIVVADFANENLAQWQTKSFKGDTRYTLTELDNRAVLKADSQASASGLFKEQRIDLQKTPYLNWRWRIENRLPSLDEQSKSGDDYAARIYIVVSGGLAFWKTRALNYVWANNSAKGQSWPNAFAGKNAMMVALRSTDDRTQHWYQEKRNIMQDLEQFFGEPIRYIDAVAIMTDTDNSQGKAVAYYGDLFFSAN